MRIFNKRVRPQCLTSEPHPARSNVKRAGLLVDPCLMTGLTVLEALFFHRAANQLRPIASHGSPTQKVAHVSN